MIAKFTSDCKTVYSYWQITKPGYGIALYSRGSKYTGEHSLSIKELPENWTFLSEEEELKFKLESL